MASKMSRTSYLVDWNKQRFMEEVMNRETHKRLSEWHKDSGPSTTTGASRQYEVSYKKIQGGCPRPTTALAALADTHQLSDFRRRKVDPECSALQEKNLQAISSINRISSSSSSNRISSSSSHANIPYSINSDVNNLTSATNSSVMKSSSTSRFPVTSYEYGWAQDELIPKDDVKQPLHAKKRVVADSFYTRNA